MKNIFKGKMIFKCKEHESKAFCCLKSLNNFRIRNTRLGNMLYIALP